MAKYISNELIAEILCLLPVKSLLRFECISKSWYSLIHDPLFIKSHLRVSTKTKYNSVLVGHAKYSDLCLAGLRSPPDFVKVDFPPPRKDSFAWKYKLIKVRGADNGLICLTLLDRYLILSNMATKDYHITSISSLPMYKRNRTLSLFFYGFGFESLNDDYKVVIFVRCKYRADFYAETRIYSLRHNAWSKSRRAEVSQHKLFPVIVSFDSSFDAPNGVVASSALHWLAGSYPDNNTLSSSFILAFDLASEQFRQMLLPDHVRKQQEIQIRVKRERFIEFTRVGFLEGYLCVSSRDCFENPFFDIWIMKDYKIHDSWIKFCRIMLHDKTVSSLIPVLGDNRNNFLLLEIYRSFYCFNIQKRRLNYLPNFDHGLYKTVICLGTLVSISAYRALWKKGNRARGRKRSRESRDDINEQSQFDAREQAEVNEALMYFFVFQRKFNWIQSKV